MFRDWNASSGLRILGQPVGFWIALAAILAGFWIVFTAKPVLAADIDADPALADFYSKLMQPDNPTSCCGPADAYQADITETDAAGNLIAVVTDTRPDHRQLPNGEWINRPHIKPGTKFVVPDRKKRKIIGIPNPTGHNIIFIGSPSEYDMGPGAGGYTVYCWEPAALS